MNRVRPTERFKTIQNAHLVRKEEPPHAQGNRAELTLLPEATGDLRESAIDLASNVGVKSNSHQARVMLRLLRTENSIARLGEWLDGAGTRRHLKCPGRPCYLRGVSSPRNSA